MKAMPRGCLALLGAALVLITVSFGTGALFVEVHRPGGLRFSRLALLSPVLLVPLIGAVYLMYLEFRPGGRS